MCPLVKAFYHDIWKLDLYHSPFLVSFAVYAIWSIKNMKCNLDSYSDFLPSKYVTFKTNLCDLMQNFFLEGKKHPPILTLPHQNRDSITTFIPVTHFIN